MERSPAQNYALSASLEDYLRTILQIMSEKNAARAKDISQRMKVTRPSVTGALHSLRKRGLINHDPYGLITLTAKGRTAARDIVRRRDTLRAFFRELLRVDDREAETAACRMEHAVSQKILDRLIHFLEFVRVCPLTGARWLDGFGFHCNGRTDGRYCDKCIDLCLKDLGERRATNSKEKRYARGTRA